MLNNIIISAVIEFITNDSKRKKLMQIIAFY